MEALDLEQLLAWIWARHHNPASWYVRPLFLLPYCWFAWRRSLRGLVATLLLFPTTLFWFAAPAGPPDPAVAAYLEAELRLLTNGWAGPVSVTLAAAVFLGLLAWAFWQRSWLAGLLVLHLGTAAKVAWSLWAWGPSGQASVLPSIATLLVCDVAVLGAWLWRHRSRRAIHPR